MSVAVSTDALSKRYGDLLAVDRIDLRLPAARIYALVGLNGAGKTTLIRMLLGMVRPTSGTITVLDTSVPPGPAALWSRVGYLVETPAAYPELTVRENLDLVRRLRRQPRTAVDDVLDRLALTPYGERRARHLSLGNQQRLGLAKALLHGPELLVLDEPINGLDPAGVVEVRSLLRELSAQGTTIFLSSHILSEVARTADRVGIIHQGRLVHELDAEQLSTLTRRRLLVCARDPAAARAALLRAGHDVEPVDAATIALRDVAAIERPDSVATLLVEAGCPPTRLSVEHEDLEQYFLRVVGVERAG